MVISIHQPNYIPWLGYFDKIKKSDIFIFLDDVQYSGDKISSRNLIRTLEGKQYLSIPIRKRRELLLNVEIDDTFNWRKKHWNCIQNSYRKSVGWDYLSSEVEEIYQREWEKLVDINIEFILLICRKLNISSQFIRSSSLSGKFGTKSERILNICKYFKADTFLSGMGAKNYIEIDKFLENDIRIEFQKFGHPVYEQISTPFLYNLSALDFIFQCGNKSMQIFKNIDIM